MLPIIYFLVYVFLGMIFIKILDIDEFEYGDDVEELDLEAYTILVTFWPITCLIFLVFTIKNYFEDWR